MAEISTIFTFLLLLLLLLLFLLWLKHQIPTNAKRAPPEAAGRWPVIGHLHLLGGLKPTHLTLASMADTHGPIFTVRFGFHRTLVVSSPEIVRECFSGDTDLAFSNRPPATAVEIMGYNYAMFGFSPYGSYWRALRKIATFELLSNHRLSMLGRLRESELRSAVKELYELCVAGDRAPVEMKRWFAGLNLNLIVKIIGGNRFEETKMASPEVQRWGKAVREFFDLLGVVTPSDAIPFLKGLDLGGYEKIMKTKAGVVDRMLQEWLEDHKLKRSSGEAEKDFMDVLISILEENAPVGAYDLDTINKATCLSLLLGGTDTTAVTLTWALSYLLNNPLTLKKLQEELDTHVGKERQVKESDLKNLVYLQSIIKETLRLNSPAQIMPPRQCSEDCTIGGYHVPAGTRLFVNLWKLHRDPHAWPDPFEFKPERFMATHKEVDYRGQNYEYVPFGSGRRACPGISFGIQVMQFTLATLVHGFDIETPLGEVVDMTEASGFNNPKATPLQVVLTPRLPLNLYG